MSCRRGAAGRRAAMLVALGWLGGARPSHAADAGSAQVPSPSASPSTAGEAATASERPKQLSIAVVYAGNELPTFRERVQSWFSDGTRVSVTLEREVIPDQLLASRPQEIRVWVILLSSERALVSFSVVTGDAGPRYLTREVRLRQGFDDLGLERLASVIHSATAALLEGVEGVERAQAEQRLLAAGVLSPADLAADAPVMPDLPLPRPPAARAPASPATSVATRPAGPATRPVLVVGAAYGIRARGAETLGHGPMLTLGAQLPSARGPLALELSAQFLLPSAFNAGAFSASVQTSALRARAGFEPPLGSAWHALVLLGGGADLARIETTSSVALDASGELAVPHGDGSQWRGAIELVLGVVRYGNPLDLGLAASLNVLLGDVHYSANTRTGEQRLLSPWPLQPGIALQGRFRSVL